MSYIDLPIGVAGVCAHITTIRKPDGKIVLRGYAMDQESGAKVGPRHQRTCNQSIHSEKHEAQILANIIRDEYCGSQARAEKTKRAPSAAGAYSDAYMNFLRLDIHNPKWNFNTEYKARTYFERNILPRLDALGTDLSSEDLAEIKNDLVEMAVKSKNGNQNPNQAEKSVSQYLYRVNWILEQIYACNPSLRELYFDTAKTTVVPVTEEAKYIPDRVRVCMAYVLMRSPANGLSLGVAAMWKLGDRTAEACAIKIGDIILREEGYVVCKTFWQIQNGQRIPRLKTESAYRYTIGDYFMYCLVMARIEYLRQAGYTDEEIWGMPLVSDPDDPCKYADPSALSSYAKALLLTCGYSQERFQLAASLSVREPLDVDGPPEKDVTAYILRRDWAGRAMNVCGLPSADVDYLIGHKNPATKEKDYTNPDVQKEIAQKLERHVFLPEYSKHPYFAPICPKQGQTIDLEGYNAYRICASEQAIEVKLDIVTAECGEPITISTNGTMKSAVEQRAGTKDTPELRRARPLIGSIHPDSYYQELEEEAGKMDISEFQ